MTKKTRRRYSDEFKAEAVNMVRGEGYAISEAARRLDIDRSLLDRWCRQQRDREDGVTDDQADERDAEIMKLREEVRKLRIEKEVLKRPRPSSRESRAEIPVHRVGEGLLPSGGAVPCHGRQPQWLLCLASA